MQKNLFTLLAVIALMPAVAHGMRRSTRSFDFHFNGKAAVRQILAKPVAPTTSQRLNLGGAGKLITSGSAEFTGWYKRTKDSLNTLEGLDWQIKMLNRAMIGIALLPWALIAYDEYTDDTYEKCMARLKQSHAERWRTYKVCKKCAPHLKNQTY